MVSGWCPGRLRVLAASEAAPKPNQRVKEMPRVSWLWFSARGWLGSLAGGHTAEMLRLLGGTDRARLSPRIYITAHSDHMSEARAREFEGVAADVVFEKVPRSREVRQGWLSTAMSTLRTCLRAGPLIWRHCPDVVGPPPHPFATWKAQHCDLPAPCSLTRRCSATGQAPVCPSVSLRGCLM